MLATILAAAAMFAATNIDDIVVLTALFLASSRGQPRAWHIVGGQYAGFITLVGLSLLAALGLTIVPDEWVGLLGIFPLILGILGLIRGLKREGDDDDENKLTGSLGLLGIAGITIANGADNIAIYTPVFRTMAPADTTITVIVFLALVAVWCALGKLIGTHHKVVETLEKIEHWLVPAVFIGLGLTILIGSGSLQRLINLWL
ncbi:cadmium resistance transporter [Pseudarthrobacter sp. NPDC092184]|uniref:cadmium resistance transporter n=1 Tax=Pseudarthrobacter TaxID=1742993 RepID=UPI00168A63C9|nr:cadmium resistance transporter [Pseudarthrobacter sp. BIM B-2242]QOD01958.1 cadmium resistance transporter [Pseudarthrobacter sp. BIM B-2242]BFE45706.1 CadD family cadmium resistance transporter [Pseudarthrobacter oxydans]